MRKPAIALRPRPVVVSIASARESSPQAMARQMFKYKMRLREWGFSYARGKRTRVRQWATARVWKILAKHIDQDDLNLPQKHQGFVWIGVQGIVSESRGTMSINTVRRSLDILIRAGLLQRKGGKGGKGKRGWKNTGIMRLVYHPGLRDAPGADEGFGLPDSVRDLPTSEIIKWIFRLRENTKLTIDTISKFTRKAASSKGAPVADKSVTIVMPIPDGAGSIPNQQQAASARAVAPVSHQARPP